MSDQQARRLAVDPSRSVIVQAPAGSGKTTLLVERYLALLAVVDEPEQILAMTFTRKAAGEMRQRILQYLTPEFESAAAHEQAALANARAVAAKVAAWNLRDNPQRMQIRTIDSFNHRLARAMPVATALGPVPTPADENQGLYELAAQRTLQSRDTGPEFQDALSELLTWLDHRVPAVEDLLVSMLKRREQWLPWFRDGLTQTDKQRRALEQAMTERLSEVLAETLAQVNEALARCGVEPRVLMTLSQRAAEAAPEAGVAIDQWPQADPASLADWRALSQLLVTTSGALRKTVNKNQGFAPDNKDKPAMMGILEALQAVPELGPALQQAAQLPEGRYSDAQWSVLQAMITVLTQAVQQLKLVFAEQGVSDFIEVAEAAQRGLGEVDAPTDLALSLDCRIEHILVDEYQDTNWTQFNLLQRLVAGWQPGDGRSLFVVGDPMQSIYRFREAEVGLFIRTRDQGINGLKLEPLQLTNNFRSKSEIIHWVNQRLGSIFPEIENIPAGAVRYAPSTATQGEGGSVLTLAASDGQHEAARITAHLEQVLADHPDENFKVAIIVRARTHLADILPALQARGLRYRAVKLDPLTTRPIVQDLLALTRAVLDPADPTAWLSVLRAPWCGLDLAALLTVAEAAEGVLSLSALDALSNADRARAEPVVQVLLDAQSLWRRRPLRDVVEGAWRCLGGAALCQRPETDQRDAANYLDQLEAAELGAGLADWDQFVTSLDQALTEGDPAAEGVRIEVLTIHAAKGLEWDVVVLPQLHKGPRQSDTDLVYWLPFVSAAGQARLLLGPQRAATDRQHSPLVQWIKREQSQREAYERLRMLYVATTRAQQQLVLSACIDPELADQAKPKTPRAGSLLADLWPVMAEAWLAASAAPQADDTTVSSAQTTGLRRVVEGWRTEIGEAVAWSPDLPAHQRIVEVEFNWAGLEARRIGTALHRLLERIGRIGVERVDAAEQAALLSRVPVLLGGLGSAGEQRQQSMAIIERALNDTLNSDVGRWVLSGAHQHAACELSVSGKLDGEWVNVIIDRTFVDDDGTRWIVDYKSGYHAGGNLEGFIEEEQARYSDQLDRYRRLFEQLESRPVRCALYLPRHGRLVEY